jgi:hypothetical protein
MWRYASALVLVAGLSGCVSVDSGIETGGPCTGNYGRGMPPPSVPGVQGPHGQNVPMIAPYSSAPPGHPMMAYAMMSRSVPMDMVQMNRPMPAAMNPGLQQTGFTAPPGAGTPNFMMPKEGILSPPGVPFAPGMPGGAMMPPGMVPGGMPRPDMMAQAFPPGAAMPPPGAIPAASGIRFPVQRTQVRVSRPSGMKVSWYTVGPDGKASYSATPIEVPGRYNFLQGAIYRLKLGNIEGRPGLEVYPTLEVVPANPRTESFLAHSSVPLEFTGEDFKQIAEGNYVIKVIYLPHPQYQELAGTGTEEILSTRLEPGANPITEALRRGDILLIIRMGNVDQEAPNTPPLGAPGAMPMMPGLMPGMPAHGGPPLMVPYFGKPGMMPLPPGATGPHGPTMHPGGHGTAPGGAAGPSFAPTAPGANLPPGFPMPGPAGHLGTPPGPFIGPQAPGTSLKTSTDTKVPNPITFPSGPATSATKPGPAPVTAPASSVSPKATAPIVPKELISPAGISAPESKTVPSSHLPSLLSTVPAAPALQPVDAMIPPPPMLPGEEKNSAQPN